MTTDDEIKLYEARTGIKLDAHNKGTLGSVIERENRFCEAEAVREDNHNTPVEGYYEEPY